MTVDERIRIEESYQGQHDCWGYRVIVSPVLSIHRDQVITASRYDRGGYGDWQIAVVPGDMPLSEVLTSPDLEWHRGVTSHQLYECMGLPACPVCNDRTGHHAVQCPRYASRPSEAWRYTAPLEECYARPEPWRSVTPMIRVTP